MSANSPSEHYANHASCSAAPGMPSEEDIARAILENPPNRSWEPCKDSMRLVRDHTPTARAILSLIRPAFEAKDAEIERLKALPVIADYIEVQDARRAAEAKLAQAVEALTAVGPYVDAIICYASTISEHDGNRVAKLVGDCLALAEGKEG